MASDTFLVGNGAGFSGDRIDAPIPVVATLEASGRPSALFFEVLGERTIALAQLARNRDPALGYEPMLERLLAPILEPCARAGITIIGNFGAANPQGAARVIARLAMASGLPALKIAVVSGDDVLDLIGTSPLTAHEADGALEPPPGTPVAANAYLDAAPIVAALREGADVVVTGRTGDPSLALAPLIHHFGWSPEDWDKIAAGALAGHLLECGAQLSGGVFFEPDLKDVPDPANLGFPIAEVSRDGALVVTKADGTGGRVDKRSVTEQLLYEIHDPSAYLTPDVTVDLSEVWLEDAGTDRVAVLGVRGRPAPEALKVTVSSLGGFLGEGEVSVAGPNALARARATAAVLRERLARRELPVRARIDLIGVASVHDNDAGTLSASAHADPPEVRIRLAAAGEEETAVSDAAREVLALLCCGVAGTGGARWRVTPRIATRSGLLARERISASAVVAPASALLS